MPEGPVIDTNLGPAPAAPANPIAQAGGVIGMMSDLASIRNKQNEALLFQQQMAARHKMGEDLAVLAGQGKSPEEQIGYISHQPYAPFVTPEIGNFRASNLAGVQVQKTQQELLEVQQRMANAGLGPLSQALISTGGDPKKLPAAFDMVTAAEPPELQATHAKMWKAMKSFVFDGLPTDTAEANKEVQARLLRVGGPFGLPLDKLYAATTGGVAPQLTEMPTPSGAMQKGLAAGTGFTPMGQGPGTAEQEYMKSRGEQLAGPKPQFHEVTGLAGQKIPLYTSGDGAGGITSQGLPQPGTGASPLLPPGAGTATPPPGSTPTVAPPPAAPPQTRTIEGPSIASQGYLEGTAKLGAGIAEETSQNSLALPVLAKRVSVMADALKEFKAGGGTSSFAALSSFAQALQKAGFPVTDKQINAIGNDNLPAEQVFNSLISRAAVQSLKADAEGTGRVMRSEVDRYLDAIGVNRDPEAIRVLFNNLRWNMLVGYDQAQKFKGFRDKVKRGEVDIEDFGPDYAKNFDENKMEAPKGIDLKEIRKGEVKGTSTTPAKVTHRWNPETQSIEEVK